jgi:predicted MPP superfamily phosphohydrolase
MRFLFLPLIGTGIIWFLGFDVILQLKYLHKPWWRRTVIRRLAWGLPIFGWCMLICWWLAEMFKWEWLLYPGPAGTSVTILLLVTLSVALPIAWLIRVTGRLLQRWFDKSTIEVDEANQSRRRFISRAAAIVPSAAVAGSLAGVGGAFLPAEVVLKRFSFEKLHPALEGLRILHLSDLHLGTYLTLSSFQATIDEAEKLKPDMVVLTGDVADNLRQLAPALRMAEELDPRLGTYACLGNHEYYRGIPEVVRTFGESGSQLLVNRALTVDAGGATVTIGGVDDPRFLGAAGPPFFKRAIDETLEAVGASDFTMLLSHRPGALDYASEVGADLILAGHTHGAQLGLAGRSILEPFYPEAYLWGEYRVRNTRLYTSSGLGHWFPFRLGCPPEAPIIELTRA